MSSCTKIPAAQAPCQVRFPGGAIIQAVSTPCDGDFDRGLALMRAMTPALAALAPVFALIGAVLGLKKFVEAFTTFPPDLAKLAEGIDEFLTSVNKLVSAAPPVSVPLLIKDLLTCMLTFLAGMIGVLRAVQDQEARIQEARDRALELDLPDLDELMDCAEDNVQLYLQHVALAMGSFGTLFAVLQTLGDVAGIDLPGVDFDVSGTADEAIEKLENIVLILTDILEALP